MSYLLVVITFKILFNNPLLSLFLESYAEEGRYFFEPYEYIEEE